MWVIPMKNLPNLVFWCQTAHSAIDSCLVCSFDWKIEVRRDKKHWYFKSFCHKREMLVEEWDSGV